MPARNRPHRPLGGARRRQAGVAAVEFAVVAIVFFIVLFGLIEIARAVYICNTLQEVTRRAAAAAVNTDFSIPGALSQVQQRAIFRSDRGMLAFADPITDEHIHIDYMSITRTGNSLQARAITAMPAGPVENRVNCATDPNGDSCIRLVRVRVCAPAGAGGGAECDPVPYKTIVSLISMPFTLPTSTTIMPAETLGLAQ